MEYLLYTTIMRHIAFIMDGNRSWARANHLPQLLGHKRGYENARDIIELCRTRGIEQVSIWALSDDNIRERSPEEVTYLFDLLTRAIDELLIDAGDNNVKIAIIGNRSLLRANCLSAVERAEAET
jgi:undecaprenyl diphosphate synthase